MLHYSAGGAGKNLARLWHLVSRFLEHMAKQWNTLTRSRETIICHCEKYPGGGPVSCVRSSEGGFQVVYPFGICGPVNSEL